MTAYALPTHRKCMLVMEGSPATDIDAFALLHVRSLIGVEVEKVTREREYADEVGESPAAENPRRLRRTRSRHTTPRRVRPGRTRMDRVELRYRLPSRCADDSGRPRRSQHDRHTRRARLHAAPHRPKFRDHRPAQRQDPGDGSVALGYHDRTDLGQRPPGELGVGHRHDQPVYPSPDTPPMRHCSCRAPEPMPGMPPTQSSAISSSTTRATSRTSSRPSKPSSSHNRSWTATADRLGIHRQSLAFRLRKIESVTGRNLKASSDIAMLWLALRARAHASALTDERGPLSRTEEPPAGCGPSRPTPPEVRFHSSRPGRDF